MKELAYLNKYLLRYKYRLLLGFIFVSLANVSAIIPAQLVRDTLDLVTHTKNIHQVTSLAQTQQVLYNEFGYIIFFYGTLIVAMALIRGVFLFFMRQTIIVVSRLIEYDLKNEIYTHYQNLPLSFYKKNSTGDLMARISEDVSKVRMYVGPAIMYGINLVVTFVLVISYMITINGRLTCYALLPLPFLSISIYYVNNLINKCSEQIQKSLSSMSTFVQEVFSGIRVIKAFVREEDSLNKFTDESDWYKMKSLGLTRVNSLFFPLMLAMIGLSTILTVYIGGVEVIKGTITPGNIAEFIIYVNMLTWPVTSLGWITSIIQRAAASQERINEFLREENEIISLKNMQQKIKGNIIFNKVSFTYSDSGIQALKDISFQIERGRCLAILGTTGSGKSTIAALLCRIYDTSKGSILIDRKNIKDFDISALRSQIGYVPQDVFLFSDTIRNNISFGGNTVKHSEKEIVQASKGADLYENVITLKHGFDTLSGERGITLSGGQKQRVSIARAIIRKPKILILDDSLSAVDTKTENRILNNLSGIMKNRTSVIISHRVSSAKLAHKIVVLDQGSIVETGTHESLLKQNGVYKEMYQHQIQEKKNLVDD